MGKWSTNNAGRGAPHKSIFAIFCILLIVLFGPVVAGQYIAHFYDYDPGLSGKILVVGDVTIYFSVVYFYVWMFEYEVFQSKGMLHGVVIWAMFVFLGFLGLIGAWIRRTGLIGEDAKGAHGTASWGDNTDVNLGLHQPRGIVLGKDDKGNYIIDNRQTHVLISAATGAGKSAGPVICTLLNCDWSIIVTDIKGELFSRTAGYRSTFSDVHVFDPLNSLGLPDRTTINPMLDVKIGSESIQQCGIMAKSLIPPPESKNADEHWSEKGREWVTSLLLYILYCEKVENIHLGRLYDLAVKGPGGDDSEGDGFGELMRDCTIAPYKRQEGDTDEDYERIQKELLQVEKYIHSTAQGICSMNDREAASVISTMTRNLDPFRNPTIVESMNNSTFSLRDFLSGERPQTLYVASPPQDLQMVSPIIRVLFELTTRIIMEKEPIRADTMKKTSLARVGNPLTWFGKLIDLFFAPGVVGPNLKNLWPKLYKRHNILFLLDESPKYNKLETIEKAVSLIRSYGGRIVMVAQSTTMLDKIYGKDSDLFSNCGIKLYLAVADIDEAEKITKYVGKSTIHYMSGSSSKGAVGILPNSYSKNVQTQARDLITADEVMRLSEIEGREMAILLVQGISPLKIRRTYYFEDPQLKKLSEIPFTGKILSTAREFIWHRIDRIIPTDETDVEDVVGVDPMIPPADRYNDRLEEIRRRQAARHSGAGSPFGAGARPDMRPGALGEPRSPFAPTGRRGGRDLPQDFNPATHSPLLGDGFRAPRKAAEDTGVPDDFNFVANKSAAQPETPATPEPVPALAAPETEADLDEVVVPDDIAQTIDKAQDILAGKTDYQPAEKVPAPAKRPAGGSAPLWAEGSDWRPSKDAPKNLGEVVVAPGKNPLRARYKQKLDKAGKANARLGAKNKVAKNGAPPSLGLFDAQKDTINPADSLLAAMFPEES